MSDQDRLLVIGEISTMWRMPEASIRYKKSRGELPFVFRLGRRLVAYEGDCLAYVESQRQAEKDRVGREVG